MCAKSSFESLSGSNVECYNRRMLKLIVLDWDDTIVSGSSDAYYHSYATAIEQNGISKDFETVKTQVQKLWGRPHEVVIENIIGRDQPQLSNTVRSYEQLVSSDAFSNHLSLIDGAKDALLSLKDKYTLAIATGMNAGPLKQRLIPLFGMEGIFSAIISSSQLPDPARGKPYPDMLLKLMKDFGVEPSETIMVGDATTDVFMAQAAGVAAVLVLTGRLSLEEAKSLGIQHVLPTIAALPNFVSSL
jgi:phosphoglycolate phosphatase